MSETSQALLEEKEKAHIELTGLPSSEVEKRAVLRAKLKSLSRKAAESLANDDKAQLENLLMPLQEASRKHDTRTTWKMINKIAGGERKKSIRVRSKKGPIADE